MTDNLRYVFAYGYQIQDRFDSRKSWKADPNSAVDPNSTEDYAIISRILNSKTGEILITAAGIGQAGTRAAGEFLTSPNAMNSVMLPRACRVGEEEYADCFAYHCHQRFSRPSGCDRNILLVIIRIPS